MLLLWGDLTNYVLKQHCFSIFFKMLQSVKSFLDYVANVLLIFEI